MAIDFPNSPNSGDTFSVGNVTWRWNGYAWNRVPDPGAKGEIGQKGDKGEVGLTGSIGQKGQKGDVEQQGNKGDTGAQGPQGAQGSTGDKGAKGDKGDTGPQGPQGSQGSQGQKGEIGNTGPAGPTGPQGPAGSGGSTGPTGPPGPSGSDAALPSGFIGFWSGSVNSIPSGWYLCNGSNGTPDLRNRFVIGAGTGSNYSPGNTGGSGSVLLGTANLPSHNHGSGSLSASGGNHSHTYIDQYVVINNGYRPWPASNNDCAARNVSTGGNGSHTHSISGSTGNQGSGQSFSILPPYYALCYIMKA